jgi:prolyl-tRNA editing enzyme YbaK/EbsC (Cys-tRNA(Pro) deacylase)
MSIDKVKKYLEQYNMSDNIIVLNESSATVLEAAKALNCEPELIAKSLTFYAPDPIMIVTAGDVKIDNSKYKKEFNTKAKMIPATEVEDVIGHKVGGVCPFAIKDNVKVYLDDSLKRFEYVYPACGSSNSAIKLSIKELEDITNYIKWIDVCKL